MIKVSLSPERAKAHLNASPQTKNTGLSSCEYNQTAEQTNQQAAFIESSVRIKSKVTKRYASFNVLSTSDKDKKERITKSACVSSN